MYCYLLMPLMHYMFTIELYFVLKMVSFLGTLRLIENIFKGLDGAIFVAHVIIQDS